MENEGYAALQFWAGVSLGVLITLIIVGVLYMLAVWRDRDEAYGTDTDDEEERF